MNKSKWSWIVITVSVLALFGCGGGAAQSTQIDASGETNARWFLSNATVCAYEIAGGLKGKQIDECSNTGANGSYRINLGAYNGGVLVEASGGFYLDLATGLAVQLATTLHTVVVGSKAIDSANISPLTDAIVLIGAEYPGGLNDANISRARDLVKSALGFDPATAKNVDPAKSSSTVATAVEKVHGIYLGAVFQYIKNGSRSLLLDAISDFSREIKSDDLTASSLSQKAVAEFLSSARNKTGINDMRDFSVIAVGMGVRRPVELVVSKAVTGRAVPIISLENAKTAGQGVTSKWHITRPALNHEIEGYASATSVNRGETIDFYINTVDPTFDISIYRVGWYGGAGARLMSTTSLPGQSQARCPTIAATLTTECDWDKSFTLAIPDNPLDPTDWASGVYLAKLTGSGGKQQYIVFVVRDDDHVSDFLFQASFTTYQAYNNWGGNSFYTSNSIDGKAASILSFNRPYAGGNGAGEFLTWEVELVRFMEKEGYDVSYATSIDTHLKGANLMHHKAFLSVGHDEYWTREIRDNLERGRDAGVNLGFLGANAGYWQIRLEPDSRLARPGRTMIAYRSVSPGLDPVYGIHPELATAAFRSVAIHRPEAELVGVMFDYNSLNSDIVISDCASFICSGTDLVSGSKLPFMLGYEVDRLDASSPKGIQAFALSPYVVCLDSPTCSNLQTRYSAATIYQAPGGALVFATGSMQWNWGLSPNGPHIATSNVAIQQMTRNVLNRFCGKS